MCYDIMIMHFSLASLITGHTISTRVIIIRAVGRKVPLPAPSVIKFQAWCLKFHPGCKGSNLGN